MASARFDRVASSLQRPGQFLRSRRPHIDEAPAGSVRPFGALAGARPIPVAAHEHQHPQPMLALSAAVAAEVHYRRWRHERTR